MISSNKENDLFMNCCWSSMLKFVDVKQQTLCPRVVNVILLNDERILVVGGSPYVFKLTI